MLLNYLCFENESLVLFNVQKPNRLLSFRYSPFSISEIENTLQRIPDIHFMGLLGIKLLDNIPYLLVVADAEPCCKIGVDTIHEIKRIEWIPIVKQEQLQIAIDKTEEQIREMSKLFEEGYYYYSDKYRLHTTYYCNIMQQQTAEQRKYYSQFIFNEKLMMLDEKTNISQWCKPIIQGYIEQFTHNFAPAHQITYTLISRRSNKKQGTRYFARGIDDKGHVANFTQTEEIISYGKFMISHIQVRGSVPAFFQQLGITGITGQLNITRNEAMSQKAFQTHFSKLSDIYNKIFCVNLLSIKKPQQQKLTFFFQNLIQNYAPDTVRYEYFDFHEQCKNNTFENSEKLITKLKPIIKNFGLTIFDIKIKKLIDKQCGVIRTNCLDCLDRTNYMQSRIALYKFKKVIQNFSCHQIRENIVKQQMFTNKYQFSSEILQKFNYAWGQNGDKISLHYTGIGSTHTDIIKVGKRTFTGTINHKMRSLMRFFVQFVEKKKNDAIRQITTNPLMKKTGAKHHLLGGQQFITLVLMSFDITKLGEDKMERNKMCGKFIEGYIEMKKPDGVVLFGYRRYEVSLLQWLKGNKPHADIQCFADEQISVINKLGYETVHKVLNEDNCMLVFGNQKIVQNATKISHQNLGSHENTLTISKLCIYNCSMVFSGANCISFDNFKVLLQKSHDEAFQYDRLGKARSSSILQLNYRTVLGNTSSRNKLSVQYLKSIKLQLQKIKNGNDGRGQTKIISQILDNDQLTNEIQINELYLKNYMEGPAYFVPEENRIIFWNKENLVTKVLDYNAYNSLKCVYGNFSYQLH